MCRELQHEAAEVLIVERGLDGLGVKDDVVHAAHLAFLVQVLARRAQAQRDAHLALVGLPCKGGGEGER